MATQLTFDAPGWLSRFQAAGGAYALTGEHLHLWPAPGSRTPEDRTKAYAMVATLAPDQRQHLVEHLRSDVTVEG